MEIYTDKRLRNWGNYPQARAEIAVPENENDAAAYLKSQHKLIARGNGKCYGDAALSGHVLSTLRMNKILHFDAEKGIVHGESGVLLHDILKICVPRGWFFHVTPGIKNITLGGAIACDVHGKNHPAKGCFSNWLLSFELMLADGTRVHCSKSENADLFWQSCGGMGWTGVILSASFQLMPLKSIHMRQKAVRASNLESLFCAMEENTEWAYAAGWVDCLSDGPQTGRGVLYLAEHIDTPDEGEMKYPEPGLKNVPFYAPGWLLNKWTIKAHNAMLFSGAKTAESVVNLDRYFYPLDGIRNWNRLYGRRGFIQYQFGLPESNAQAGMIEILQAIRKSGNMPFLSVLKRHGERPKEAIHSFPEKGFSLALDFPMTRTVFTLVRDMDEIVWKHGGKIYLAKDACSDPKMGRLDPKAFGDPKFSSLLRQRISQTQAP